MRLEYPDRVAHGFGQLTLSTVYLDGFPPVGVPALTLLRYDELTEAAAVSAEGVDPGASKIQVRLDDANGGSRPAHLQEGMMSHGAGRHVVIRAVLRPTTQAIRSMLNDQLIEKLVRPKTPPQVEALVLSERPLLIAMRMRGVTNPVKVALREDLPGEPNAMAYANEEIQAKGRGDYPCWLVMPDDRGREGDQGASLRLTLLDAFHRWNFHYAR